MPIFQKSVIQKYQKGLNTVWLNTAYDKFNEIFSSKKIEKIKNLKEEEYQDGFLRDLFVEVLGYTLKPDDDFNLVREFKNQTNSKKADGAILKDEKAVAVIELKSTKTKDLTKITEQAFNYKNNQPDCKYVITSNFQKLRFYVDYSNEYEEFDLFNLKKSDFELLYLILRKKSIFADTPQKLKDETRFHEEKISKQLYEDYSNFKNNIFENLVKNNPEIEKLTLFKKTQKLLDRLLFIFFAEDCGLLPPNSIARIIDKYEQLIELDAYKPLYDIYKQYFGFMNTGRKGKTSADDIPAYNGGLFALDKLLDSFKIDDKILKADCLKLSAYDFNTEVDVNILGQIFEHSLNEIEEMEQKLSENNNISKSKTSKRKKDGVFYTPKYITQYIVENTIGTLCTEKRKEMNIYEIEFDETYKTQKGTLNKKGKELYDKLSDYKNWLKSLKIIDPACGSGAFLNQALNFLIGEHKLIDDLIAELTGDNFRLFDTDKSILENNLFGVDINEESVEIAKLSLWLRTAQKGRKLSTLNNNIKCGNSLIDDPKVAGDKAFDWNKEFKKIMDNGGFDVVIGNPPYVVLSQNEFSTYTYTKGNNNTYVAFVEKSLKILKTNGKLSFIIPNTWFSGDKFSVVRDKLLIDYDLQQIIQLPYDIFNAYIDTSIIIISNHKSLDNTLYYKYDIRDYQNEININKLISFPTNEWLKFNKIFLNYQLLSFGDKVWFSSKNLKLGEISKINRGSLPPKDNEKSQIETEYYNIKWFDDQVFRYEIEKRSNSDIFVNYKNLRENKNIEVYNSKKLIARQLMSRQFRMNITYLNEPYAFKKNLYAIYDLDQNFNYFYLLAILNSKLFSFIQVNFNTSLQRDDFPAFSLKDFKNFPIAKIAKENQHTFIEKTNLMLSLNTDLQTEKNNFLKTLQEEKSIEKLSNKLKNFQNLEYEEFKKELRKKKVKINLGAENNEWREYFNISKQKINELQSQINQTDKEIDKMVYRLYELTDEEIKIVENSVK